MKKPPKARTVLQQDCEPLRNLVEAARTAQSLTAEVRRALTEPESQHIACVVPSKTGAVVWADSAAWASRLRFQTQALLQAIRAQPGCSTIQNVTLRVLIAPQSNNKPARRARLSDKAAEALWTSADHLNDEKLSEALRRIAANAEQT